MSQSLIAGLGWLCVDGDYTIAEGVTAAVVDTRYPHSRLILQDCLIVDVELGDPVILTVLSLAARAGPTCAWIAYEYEEIGLAITTWDTNQPNSTRPMTTTRIRADGAEQVIEMLKLLASLPITRHGQPISTAAPAYTWDGTRDDDGRALLYWDDPGEQRHVTRITPLRIDLTPRSRATLPDRWWLNEGRHRLPSGFEVKVLPTEGVARISLDRGLMLANFAIDEDNLYVMLERALLGAEVVEALVRHRTTDWHAPLIVDDVPRNHPELDLATGTGFATPQLKCAVRTSDLADFCTVLSMLPTAPDTYFPADVDVEFDQIWAGQIRDGHAVVVDADTRDEITRVPLSHARQTAPDWRLDARDGIVLRGWDVDEESVIALSVIDPITTVETPAAVVYCPGSEQPLRITALPLGAGHLGCNSCNDHRAPHFVTRIPRQHRRWYRAALARLPLEPSTHRIGPGPEAPAVWRGTLTESGHAKIVQVRYHECPPDSALLTLAEVAVRELTRLRPPKWWRVPGAHPSTGRRVEVVDVGSRTSTVLVNDRIRIEITDDATLTARLVGLVESVGTTLIYLCRAPVPGLPDTRIDFWGFPASKFTTSPPVLSSVTGPADLIDEFVDAVAQLPLRRRGELPDTAELTGVLSGPDGQLSDIELVAGSVRSAIVREESVSVGQIPQQHLPGHWFDLDGWYRLASGILVRVENSAVSGHRILIDDTLMLWVDWADDDDDEDLEDEDGWDDQPVYRNVDPGHRLVTAELERAAPGRKRRYAAAAVLHGLSTTTPLVVDWTPIAGDPVDVCCEWEATQLRISTRPEVLQHYVSALAMLPMSRDDMSDRAVPRGPIGIWRGSRTWDGQAVIVSVVDYDKRPDDQLPHAASVPIVDFAGLQAPAVPPMPAPEVQAPARPMEFCHAQVIVGRWPLDGRYVQDRYPTATVIEFHRVLRVTITASALDNRYTMSIGRLPTFAGAKTVVWTPDSGIVVFDRADVPAEFPTFITPAPMDAVEANRLLTTIDRLPIRRAAAPRRRSVTSWLGGPDNMLWRTVTIGGHGECRALNEFTAAPPEAPEPVDESTTPPNGLQLASYSCGSDWVTDFGNGLGVTSSPDNIHRLVALDDAGAPSTPLTVDYRGGPAPFVIRTARNAEVFVMDGPLDRQIVEYLALLPVPQWANTVGPVWRGLMTRDGRAVVEDPLAGQPDRPTVVDVVELWPRGEPMKVMAEDQAPPV